MDTINDDEPWSPTITRLLLNVDYGALEQEYYGPFNTLLTNVFPFNEHYIVAPQAHPNHRDAVDFLIEFMLLVDNIVVGGFEIKRELDIDNDAGRLNAHQQVLDRFRTMHGFLQLPVFIMVSAIGKHCRVYRYTRETRISVPSFADPHDKSQWSIDLSTIHGRRQLNTVFNEIKQNAP